MIYQITIDADNNVTGYSIDGYISGGITVDSIPQEVLETYFDYKYIDGAFIYAGQRVILRVKDDKIAEINAECEKIITAGVDIGDKHYSLTQFDQLNLASLIGQANLGLDVPYHADGCKCQIYSAEDFMTIYGTAMYLITYHTTYANLLKSEIKDMTSIQDINAVVYGAPLTVEDQTIMAKVLGAIGSEN